MRTGKKNRQVFGLAVGCRWRGLSGAHWDPFRRWPEKGKKPAMK
jgi:hypothetical protein